MIYLICLIGVLIGTVKIKNPSSLKGVFIFILRIMNGRQHCTLVLTVSD